MLRIFALTVILSVVVGAACGDEPPTSPVGPGEQFPTASDAVLRPAATGILRVMLEDVSGRLLPPSAYRATRHLNEASARLASSGYSYGARESVTRARRELERMLREKGGGDSRPDLEAGRLILETVEAMLLGAGKPAATSNFR